MTKEQLVLARVRTDGGSVSICADERLSMQVQEQMLRQDWPLPTEIGTEEANMSISDEMRAQAAVDDQDIFVQSDLEIMAQNKDIMCKIPDKTKFRFVKRILNRLLRLTNRYQQIFNQSVYSAISILAGTLQWMKPALRMTDAKANRAISRCDAIEEQIFQLEEKYAQEASRNQELQEKIQLLEDQLQMTESIAQDTALKVQAEHRHQKDQDRTISAAARDLIRAKWQLRDMRSEQKNENDRRLRCGICGYSAPAGTFETKETDCIFAGGHLKRFICPECGCIFGPTKFADQTKQEFDDDYTVHYAGFQEGDSTHKEKFAFEQLRPTKDGIYLNYGCGRWSHTIEELRTQGYQVYGYDPYAADIDNPHVITDIKELSKMRFDGIFSNDLLEHLADPIRELQFMKLLLRKPESRMSHCTGCFHYKYEYTRFHMFFFTGNSVHVLAEKAGLSILGHMDEPSSEDPCYVFGIQNSRIDLLHHMMSTDQSQAESGIKAGSNEVIFGPYLTLPPGEYVFTVHLSLPSEIDEVQCNITSEHGEKILQSLTLFSGYNHISVILNEVQTDLELVIPNTAPQGDILVEQLALTPKAINQNSNS